MNIFGVCAVVSGFLCGVSIAHSLWTSAVLFGIAMAALRYCNYVVRRSQR